MRVPEPQIMIVTLGFGNKIVVIGPSKSASWKRKTIPGAGGELTCPTAGAKTTSAHRRAWIGGATYSDTFSVSVSGRSVTVRRTDVTKGWGMDLKIACKYGHFYLPSHWKLEPIKSYYLTTQHFYSPHIYLFYQPLSTLLSSPYHIQEFLQPNATYQSQSLFIKKT